MEISQGDIWLTNFNPTKGHEQAGIRPAVVISVNTFNNSVAELVFVCPLTTKKKNIPLHIEIGKERGVTQKSYIKPEDTRSISTSRLIKKMGHIGFDELEKIKEMLKILLGIL